MANEVKILVNVIDKATATLNKIQAELTKTGQAGKTGFMGMASGALAAVGGVAALGGAVAAAANFAQGAVNDWADYNEEIRKMSIATGAAPEDLSRMMQAADDLGVSMDSLQTAFKLVAKNGVQPTIANIAKLSDQLLAITDPTKRAEEAARLFGRQWAEIAPFVLAGSEAIMDGTAAIDENMVATQKSIDQSREYKVAIDDLTDRWTALKNSAAMVILPVAIEGLEEVNPAIDKILKFMSIGVSYETTMFKLRGAAQDTGTDIAELIQIQADLATAMGDTTAQERATKAIFDYRTSLGVAGANYDPYIAKTQEAAGVTDDFAETTEQAASIIFTSKDAMSYANQAMGEYITNTNLAQEAQDALGLATGELTLTEIELRDGILRVTQALRDGLITPKQWADMMVILGDETIIAADKVAILRGYINSLKDKTVTITVNMVKTGNYAAGATGVEIEGVTGNAGGGGARLPANPATNKVTGGKGQSGLDMVVPPGYPNDQFPIFASSGERAIIVPENARYITGGYNGIGGGVIIQNFNIYQQPGQSAMALAEIIAYQASRQSTASAAGIKYAGR